MHLPLEHKNSSFSHVGAVRCDSADLNHGHVGYYPARFHQSSEMKILLHLTTIEFIRVVATVINAVTSLRQVQTHPVVEAAKRSGGWTLELP